MSADWLNGRADWLAAMGDHKPYVYTGLAHFESSQSSQTFKSIASFALLAFCTSKTFNLITFCLRLLQFENEQPLNELPSLPFLPFGHLCSLDGGLAGWLAFHLHLRINQIMSSRAPGWIQMKFGKCSIKNQSKNEL